MLEKSKPSRNQNTLRNFNKAKSCLCLFLFLMLAHSIPALSQALKTKTTTVGNGWSGNSVNVVIFRQNSLTTFNDTQYTAWYSQDKYLMLAKRKLGTVEWEVKKTQYQGNIYDAHNSISIIVDGDGYLHVSWDHHNNKLRYSRSISPGSLDLSEEMPMTGIKEEKVTYPQFFKINNGNLLFLYRDGGSGQGNTVVNTYDLKSRKWTQLYSSLIDGEGKRNAYIQACTDPQGNIHVSWVWRETPDVASNHDMCYAMSRDGGVSWEKSTGEKYQVPITEATAEYIHKIPQNSELINQTSMTTDSKGSPVIASYWRSAGSNIPQYHLIYRDNNAWKTLNFSFRKTPFSLSGVGSKRIPISRPQILVSDKGKGTSAYLIFRDEERGSKASVAIVKDIANGNWEIKDLINEDLGSWEPSFDVDLWKERKVLNLFVQKVTQVDNEGKADVPEEPVRILEWNP